MKNLFFFAFCSFLLISCNHRGSNDYLPEDLREFANDAKLTQTWDLSRDSIREENIKLELYENIDFRFKKYNLLFDLEGEMKFQDEYIVEEDSVLFFKRKGVFTNPA